MSAMSDFLEDKIRGYIFRSGTFTQPTTLAVALITAATADADTGASSNEVANSNSYARTANNAGTGNWSAPDTTGGLTDNVGAITFPTATGSWGTVTNIRVVDSTTYGSGNCLLHGALTASKTVGNGDVFKFNAGDLDITFA